jgi:predicted TIM-barrel fold metal-dependent hydrolase
MSDIPLFDSLTHPTIDGTWVDDALDNTLLDLERQMDNNNVQWALAVGMKGIGAYDHATYANYIRSSSKRIFPVAYYDFEAWDSRDGIRRKLEAIGRLGYVAIKLHPRFSRISLRSEVVPQVIQEAAALGLGVLICTYLYHSLDVSNPNSVQDFAWILSQVPSSSKVVLLHGGDVNLLAMMELTRKYPNVLLDLSFTLCRYEGSSIDLDIKYLFKSYDRRISVGSDSPQFGLDRLRRRFDEFAREIEPDKCANVAYRNLLAFVGAE